MGLVGRILEGLEELQVDPINRRPGADIIQLTDVDPEMWRLRIGDYRVIYAIDSDELVVNVTEIDHRNRIYRKYGG
jgi:mRNA interferase RelE/StbE